MAPRRLPHGTTGLEGTFGDPQPLCQGRVTQLQVWDALVAGLGQPGKGWMWDSAARTMDTSLLAVVSPFLSSFCAGGAACRALWCPFASQTSC